MPQSPGKRHQFITGTLNFADMEGWNVAETPGWKVADNIFSRNGKLLTLFFRKVESYRQNLQMLRVVRACIQAEVLT